MQSKKNGSGKVHCFVGVEEDEGHWLGHKERRGWWTCWDWVKRLSDPLVLSHHPFTLVELYTKKHIGR